MPKTKVFVIAEAGVNHNGSLALAKKLVDAAARSGADAVKFQTFHAESLVSRYAPKAEYQKLTTGKKEGQLAMLSKLELGVEAHKELMGYCLEKSIDFLSSPFDLESIDLLSDLRVKIFKIPSGEITNLPYLRKIGSLKKKIIMSSGMSTLKEVRVALDILIKNGMRRKDIAIMHCSTEYPASFGNVNLLAMVTMMDKLKVSVGYSDHTPGIEMAAAAVACGATIIEKHLTLDKNMRGPDQKASLEPDEFRRMVQSIRNIESSLGDGIKKPSSVEIKNISAIRKSIVARHDIKKGDRFNLSNLTVKRPATGLSPMLWDKVIGRKAICDFCRDEAIRL